MLGANLSLMVHGGAWGCQKEEEEGPDVAVSIRSCSERSLKRECDGCCGDALHSCLGRGFHPIHPTQLLGLKRGEDKLATTLRRKGKGGNKSRTNATALPALDCGYGTAGCVSLQPAVRSMVKGKVNGSGLQFLKL